MRAIDADALIERLQSFAYDDWNQLVTKSFADACYEIIDVVEDQPTIEPERKTGKWIYGEHDVAMCDGYRCNKCGFFVPWDYKHKSIDYIKDYHCCPNCYAYMKCEPNED